MNIFEQRGVFPGIVMAADMSDNGFFQQEHIHARIDAFLESLEARYDL